MPATRRVAALGAAILFVCVFPANIQDADLGQLRSGGHTPAKAVTCGVVVAHAGHYSNPAKQDELPTVLRLARALVDATDDFEELLRRLDD